MTGRDERHAIIVQLFQDRVQATIYDAKDVRDALLFETSEQQLTSGYFRHFNLLS